MIVSDPIIPWKFLSDHDSATKGAAGQHACVSSPTKKSFAQAVKYSCQVPIYQLPQPCVKGDAIVIQILEVDYQEAKGFYEFSFESAQDMRSVCAIGAWNLKRGFLRLFLWTPDFNPGGICIPISLDVATNDRTFGHFSKVLVDIDLKNTNLQLNLETYLNLQEVQVNSSSDEEGGIVSTSARVVHSTNELEDFLVAESSTNGKVQSQDNMINTAVANESRLVSRMWADEDDEDVVEESYNKVFSKSKKKNLKKKSSLEKQVAISMEVDNQIFFVCAVDQDLIEQEQQAQKELMLALNFEEELWREMSGINWHTKGDRNTNFFHKVAKIRYATKSLTMLRDGEDVLTNQSAIANLALEYFTDLYASQSQTQPNNLIQSIIPLLFATSLEPKRATALEPKIATSLEPKLATLLEPKFATLLEPKLATLLEPKSLTNHDLTISLKRESHSLNRFQNAISRPGETTLAQARIFQYSPGFHPPSSIDCPRRSKTPTHVLCADDIIIFCKGIKREILALKDLFGRNQPSICASIVRNQIPNMDKPNKLAWANSVDGELSLNDAYTFIKPRGSQLNWLKVKTSLLEFSILRALNVSVHYSNAHNIIEFVWFPPTLGKIKVSTDGTTHGYPGHAGGSEIFRDNACGVLGCFVNYLGIQNSLYAELFPTFLAIKVAYAKGWHVIWMECDSTWVVDFFQGKNKISWRLSNLWDHCSGLLSLMNFKVSHIFRDGNACVDRLASFGLNSRMDNWWNNPPNFLLDVIYRNTLSFPNYRLGVDCDQASISDLQAILELKPKRRCQDGSPKPLLVYHCVRRTPSPKRDFARTNHQSLEREVWIGLAIIKDFPVHLMASFLIQNVSYFHRNRVGFHDVRFWILYILSDDFG
ncbi:hypothetical protein Lal_00027917 [Lupinus albus]|nr:hypothetical protein Lal_00027917 [Lupinus albus]